MAETSGNHHFDASAFERPAIPIRLAEGQTVMAKPVPLMHLVRAGFFDMRTEEQTLELFALAVHRANPEVSVEDARTVLYIDDLLREEFQHDMAELYRMCGLKQEKSPNAAGGEEK